ncbi:MAG: VOC family protein [Caldilineaceae bacterium]|nr:VOC family protein [Caldilineaceae bacterium]
MATTLGITKIGQVAIMVEDVDRAITFYRDVLELPFLFRYGDLAFLQCGEVRLLLEKPPENPQGAATPGNSILYYQVPDIQQAYSSLKERGVPFIDEPHMIAKMADHDLWMVFFRDSEGNTVALMAEVRS